MNKINIREALSKNKHPHYYEFSDATWGGLELRYSDLPENWVEIAEKITGKDFDALGLDPRIAIIALVGNVQPVGEEADKFNQAVAALSSEDRAVTIPKLQKLALSALVSDIIGAWNDEESERPTPTILMDFPVSFHRKVFDLAISATLDNDQKATLSK